MESRGCRRNGSTWRVRIVYLSSLRSSASDEARCGGCCVPFKQSRTARTKKGCEITKTPRARRGAAEDSDSDSEKLLLPFVCVTIPPELERFVCVAHF